MALIHEAMLAIMKDVGAIGKDSENKQQGFKFRGIDTLYNELHHLFVRHKVFVLPEVIASQVEEKTTKSGSAMSQVFLTIRYSFVAEDASSVSATVMGEGMDAGDKSTSKSMSIAQKYLLLQVFLIPTSDEKDPDFQTPDGSGGRRKRAEGSKLTNDQQDVLNHKLDEMRGPQKAPPKPSGEQIQMLQAFGEIKKKIGESEYYRILGLHGFSKSSEIYKMDEARKVYRMMAALAVEMGNQKEEDAAK